MSHHQFTQSDEATLSAIMQARRDIRGNNFSSEPVAQKSIKKILQAASWAPSVGFSQPWEFVMVEDRQSRQQVIDSFTQVNQRAKKQFTSDKQDLYSTLKLEGISEAPVNIAVFYRHSKLPVLGQSSMEETGRYSVVCAIQNMWLMARVLNIGLGWVSILQPSKISKILKAPDDAEFVAYLCLGHVKEFYPQPELEKLKWESRKPVESAIHINHF